MLYKRRLVVSLVTILCRAVIIAITTTLLIEAPSAIAQNRVDLDDMTIKGELLNDNRMRLSNRVQHQITDRVSYRTNFRREITDGLEVTWPEVEREPASLPLRGGP